MGRPTTSPAAAGGERPSKAAVLKQRDFALYWWSGMVSSPGTWLHNVTASVLILTLTGSPFMVGVVNFATFIPTLLLSLPAGSLGDRIDRRLIVGVAQGCAALFAATLTVLAATGRLTPGLLIGLCFLIGSASAVNKPALIAILPSLVRPDDLATANALNIVQFQFGQIVGPALASLILVIASPAWAFGLNAVSFLAPIVAMLLIRVPVGEARKPRSAGSGVRESLRFIARSSAMPAILVTVVLSNGAGEALRTLAPTLAAGLGDSAAAGVVIMGYSGGALFGLLAFGRLESWLAPQRALLVAFLLQALGVLAVAASPTLLLTVVGAVPIGLGFSLSTPLLSASLQQLSPDELRSRVMSTFSMAHLGVRPFFALLAGGLAAVTSTPFTLLVFAVIAVFSAAFVRRRVVQF
jgi:MFS family permease